mgnify:CR=1 FL=1
MKSGMTFQELTKLSMEELSKQPPVTLEQARKQVEELKQKSVSRDKKMAT